MPSGAFGDSAMALIRPNSTILARPDMAIVAGNYSEEGENFLADLVLPACPVDTETGKYDKEDVASIVQVPDVVRAKGSNYNRIGNEVTDANWFTREYALEMATDRHDRDRYPDVLVSEQSCSQRVVMGLKRAREVRVATLMEALAASVTIAGGSEWTIVTSTPAADVAAPAQTIEDATGVTKDQLTLILPSAVLNKLAFVTDFIDKCKAANAPFRGFATPELAALYFGVKQVWVPSARKNTASMGATATLATIWDKDSAHLIYPMKNPAARGVRQAGAGCTFRWNKMGTDYGVFTYGEDPTNTDVVRVEEFADEQLINSVYCGRIANVFA